MRAQGLLRNVVLLARVNRPEGGPSEMEQRWHWLHGARGPEWQCAGCGVPIGGLAALDLANGDRVHIDKLDCLLSYGRRWRGEASARLRALGLDPPAGLDLQ
jgi:hypothetical protein